MHSDSGKALRKRIIVSKEKGGKAEGKGPVLSMGKVRKSSPTISKGVSTAASEIKKEKQVCKLDVKNRWLGSYNLAGVYENSNEKGRGDDRLG